MIQPRCSRFRCSVLWLVALKSYCLQTGQCCEPSNSFCRQHLVVWNQVQGDSSAQSHVPNLLQHVGAYYAQFLPAMEKAVTDGLAPVEKALQVSLHLTALVPGC